MPGVTVVIHGQGEKDFLNRITAGLRSVLTPGEMRRVAYLNGTAATPREELHKAATRLCSIMEEIRSDMATCDATKPGDAAKAKWEGYLRELQASIKVKADEIDEAVTFLSSALDAFKVDFEPTDKQVLWAMNVVGVIPTSINGITLEDLLPAQEFAHIVRAIVKCVQDPSADRCYPDTGDGTDRLLEAARAYGLAGVGYGEVIVETGRDLDACPPQALDEIRKQLPPGVTIRGVLPLGRTLGLQVDWCEAGAIEKRTRTTVFPGPEMSPAVLTEILRERTTDGSTGSPPRG